MKQSQLDETLTNARVTLQIDGHAPPNNDKRDNATISRGSLLPAREAPPPAAPQALANLQRYPTTPRALVPTSPPLKRTFWTWFLCLGSGGLLSVLLRGGSAWDPAVARFRRPNGRFKRR